MLKRARMIFLAGMILVLLAPALSRAEDNVYLETIGGFGGSQIYMTYAYIGVTADAYSKNIYEASQVKVMMDETVGMLDNLMGLLKKVQETNIVENDKMFIGEMVDTIALLKEEAQALSSYASDNNPEAVEQYDLARKKAWPKIKQLLGIN